MPPPLRTYAVEIKLMFPPSNLAKVKTDLDELLGNPMVLEIAGTQLTSPRFLLVVSSPTEATLWAYYDAPTPQDAVIGKKRLVAFLDNPMVLTAIRSKVPGGKLVVSPAAPRVT
jgi:hypothetical protein